MFETIKFSKEIYWSSGQPFDEIKICKYGVFKFYLSLAAFYAVPINFYILFLKLLL